MYKDIITEEKKSNTSFSLNSREENAIRKIAFLHEDGRVSEYVPIGNVDLKAEHVYEQHKIPILDQSVGTILKQRQMTLTFACGEIRFIDPGKSILKKIAQRRRAEKMAAQARERKAKRLAKNKKFLYDEETEYDIWQ